MELLLQFVLLVVGFVMLVKGADWFVDGAAGIADKFGIPQMVIGLTIVAMGTSAPEAAVSVTAALKGSAAITIGNVVGSNILNVLIILGVTAVITSVAIAKSTLKIELPIMLAMTVLVTVIFYFILDYFETANIVPSTLSVTTSFVAVYLTFRRSPYFALAYAANDIILIILWILASIYDAKYVSVVVCFTAFLVNDIYGFISWQKIKTRQNKSL